MCVLVVKGSHSAVEGEMGSTSSSLAGRLPARLFALHPPPAPFPSEGSGIAATPFLVQLSFSPSASICSLDDDVLFLVYALPGWLKLRNRKGATDWVLVI